MGMLEFITKFPRVKNEVVSKGRVVFVSRQICRRTAFTVITQGSCEWIDPDDEKWDRKRVDMGSRKGWSVRSGNFVGLFEFLVGNGTAPDRRLHVSVCRSRSIFVAHGRACQMALRLHS